MINKGRNIYIPIPCRQEKRGNQQGQIIEVSRINIEKNVLLVDGLN